MAYLLQKAIRALAKRISKDQFPRLPAVDAQCHGDRAGIRRGEGAWWVPQPGRYEIAASHDDVLAVYDALGSFAGGLGHMAGNRERQPPGPRFGDQGLGDRVLRRLVERGGEAKYVLGREASGRVDRDQTRPAVGQRAGLVEYEDGDARHRLQRLGALDQDALFRGT